MEETQEEEREKYSVLKPNSEYVEDNYRKSEDSVKILDAMREKYGIVLDSWQKDVYYCEERYIIIKSGRQVGKTTTIGAKVTKYAAENPNKKTLIISRTQKQSGYLFDMVKQLLFAAEIPLLDEPTETKAKLKNGHIIYSLPSGWTGAGLRFLTAHLIIVEEAAYIPDEVFTAVRPMGATTNAQVIMFSTPFGPSGFFFNCWHDDQFRRYDVSSEDCKRIPLEFLKAEKQRMSKIEYQREYEGRFTQVHAGLIPIELINASMMIKECNPKNIHFIGVDVARYGSNDSVVAFCEYDSATKKSHICRVEVIKGKHRTTHISGFITALKREGKYNIKKIIVDETGVGGGVVDEIVQQLGKRLVLGINNASRGLEETSEGRRRRFIKEDLYSNIIRMMEKEELTLDDDINILRSLRNVRFEYTSKGTLTIFGPDHDVAEAIVRAAFPLMHNAPKKLYCSGMSNEEDESLYEDIDDSLYYRTRFSVM